MSKPYATLTVPERWQWHAEVYAFYRVVLGVPIETCASPCDPDGEWFDEALVRAAAARLVAKRDEAKMRRVRARSDGMEREGRAIANEWARERGFADFDEYLLVERIDYSTACVRVATSILKRPPSEPRAKFDSRTAAEALGLTARECAPTPEQLAAGRRELGLEPNDGERRMTGG